MIAALLAVVFAALPQAHPEEAPKEKPEEKPAPIKILGCEFPFGNHYRPGRWFPLEITVEAEKGWEGLLWVQLRQGGPIFEKEIKLAEKERRAVPIAVFPGTSIEGVAIEAVGASLARFAGPVPAQSLRVLLVGLPEEATAMRAALAATPSLVAFEGSIQEAVTVRVESLPSDLYSLDAFDLVALGDETARSLSPESKNLWLRWALIRGRLFASEEGRRALHLAPGQEAWVEIAGADAAAKDARRFPLAHYAPDRLLPLQLRHFVRATDPAFWLLILFGLGFSVLIFLRRADSTWSRPALLAGVTALLLAIPVIGWQVTPPVWRCMTMEEGMPGLALEDRTVGPVLPLELDSRESLLLPNTENDFLVEWHPESSMARFFRLDGDRRLFEARFLEGRQIYRGADGALRNGFAPLESVSCLLEGEDQARLLDRWNSGSTLPQGRKLLGEKELNSWPRPLRDFFGAPWVTNNWLTARIAAQDPTPASSNLGGSPVASYLLWFPRVRG